MGKRKFKAETAKILDIVINSLYSHREIFLRELISNASDALDKLKFRSLTDSDILKDDESLKIRIEKDREKKILTVKDNGIGMTQDEVIENIGTVAHSGSRDFLEKLKEAENKKDAEELIGQFGVGFYSVFMVAEKVLIETRSPYSDKGVKWVSEGDGSYTIDEIDKEDRGTSITLYLKDEIVKEEDFLDQYSIQGLVKKYSDYIRYPVEMDFETEKPEEKDDDGKVVKEKETVVETKVLNSMKPIWHRSKSEVEDDEYKEFYRHAFHAFDEPLDVVHIKGEGKVNYTALLFIPEKAPMDLYSPQYERGLKLYSKQVFIKDKCKELLPEYLGFVKGLVDSPDFSLNISREMLQHSRQLNVIGKNVEKKVLRSLSYMLKNDRDKYIRFWKEFGRVIKAGIYSSFGANKDKLKDLLMFKSTKSEGFTTLKEYVDRMPEDQKTIYYGAGDSAEAIKNMPQMEVLKEKDYEVLFFTDKIDEFAASALSDYDEKQLQSITQADLDFATEEEKKECKEKKEKQEKEYKGLLEAVKKTLGDRISDVKISERLKESPVCISSGNESISLHMEKVMKEANAAAGMPMQKVDKVLELNPDHKVFKKMSDIYEKDSGSKKIETYATVLYNQALLVEGLSIDDPGEFAKGISEVLGD